MKPYYKLLFSLILIGLFCLGCRNLPNSNTHTSSVSCTPPPCASPSNLICGNSSGCPGGCGTICQEPISFTPLLPYPISTINPDSLTPISTPCTPPACAGPSNLICGNSSGCPGGCGTICQEPISFTPLSPTSISCTPPSCASSSHLVCGSSSGCPGGCGFICQEPISFTPLSPYPISTINPDSLISSFRTDTITHSNDGSNRLFITEKAGRVWIIDNGQILPEPFLDISNLIDNASNVQGLMNVAFPSDYADSGEFFVNYISLEGDGDLVVDRYQVTAIDPNHANIESRQEIIRIDQIANLFNGGQLRFGPDGYLYMGMGGRGYGNDSEQLDTLFGKILRVSVKDNESYSIPSDNPFIGRGRGEIWATGLQSPWHFSFDRETGDLFIYDIGSGMSNTEVNFQPAGFGGRNYGWPTMEGPFCAESDASCDMTNRISPILHFPQACTNMEGGYVYRGSENPKLHGMYIFLCDSKIFGAKQLNGQWKTEPLANQPRGIISFGENQVGELIMLSEDGNLWKIVEQ